MPFVPQQAPSAMDTDGLRKHGEEQFREVARAWTEVEASIASLSSSVTAGLALKVAKAGDTMTGLLLLSADPSALLGAATKQYVDAAAAAVAAAAVLPQNYLTGLTLSTAGAVTTFNVAAGMAMNSTNAEMMTLPSALTNKTTGAWSVGSSGGALDTGTIAAVPTWYHVYLIKRPDTGVVDVCVSLSPTTPTFGTNIPAAYTRFRRIGSMRINASSQWIAFTQFGDTFVWAVPVMDANGVANTTSRALVTLTAPTGVIVVAKLRVNGAGSGVGDVGIQFSPIVETDAAVTNTPTAPNTPFLARSFGGASNVVGGEVNLLTDTSARIAVRSSTAVGSYTVITTGWTDVRGK